MNAAAVTFYSLLALFPAIAALVSIYGLFADPSQIANQLDTLSGILPGGGMEVIKEQLTRLASQGSGSLTIGLRDRRAGVAVERQWRHKGAVRCAERGLRRGRKAQLHAAQRDHADVYAGNAVLRDRRAGGDRRRAGDPECAARAFSAR